jgi:hypothetical protein
MSLAIVTTTPEGIVIAADSRQSYRNQRGMARIGSDSAQKVFQLGDRMGVTLTGIAFLPEDGVIKSISKFVDEFRMEHKSSNSTISQTAQELHGFLDSKYNYKEKINKMPDEIRADLSRQGLELIELVQQTDRIFFRFKDHDGKEKKRFAEVEKINFLLAGFNADSSYEVCLSTIPGKIEHRRSTSRKGAEYGADWIGQIDVVSRIILGFDPRVGGVAFVQDAIQKNGEGTIKTQLRGLEYVIQWGTMTLKDAVDFCMLAINTTAAIQRFSDGIMSVPGDVPGVGGPIDIAVITPGEGFRWVERKAITST